MAGWLEAIAGCMFAGKTEELLRRLTRLRFARQRYLLFKPSIENRYGQDKVVTHDGRKVDCYLLEPGKETLEELTKIVSRAELEMADVVAFDEAQFFSQKFPQLCEELVQLGKRVIVAGLDTNFRNEPFGPMAEVLALADKVTKLKAVCARCGKPATRTQRLVNGQPANKNDPEILIGGAEIYEPRCRKCYIPPR